MSNPRNSRITMDGSGITHTSLLKFLKQAEIDLYAAGDNDAAFRFEMFHEWLQNHYQPSKSFVYESRILGL